MQTDSNGDFGVPEVTATELREINAELVMGVDYRAHLKLDDNIASDVGGRRAIRNGAVANANAVFHCNLLWNDHASISPRGKDHHVMSSLR